MSDDVARSRVLRHLRPRRAPAATPRPAPSRPPAETDPDTLVSRSPELSALLADLDALRLVLATDLELAAAAVDADLPALAAEAVDADRAELAGFEQRALARLRSPREADAADGAPGLDVDEPLVLVDVAATGRHRLRRFLPAVPTFAAAALVGLLAGLVPGVAMSRPVESVPTTAAASYAELARLTRGGAHSADLRAAAADLHQEVVRLLPVDGQTRTQVEQALVLLELEAAVLSASPHRGELEEVIAESQRLWHMLNDALPRVELPSTPSLPAVSVPVQTRPVPAPAVSPPATVPEPGSGPTPQPEGSADPGSQPPSPEQAPPEPPPEPAAEGQPDATSAEPSPEDDSSAGAPSGPDDPDRAEPGPGITAPPGLAPDDRDTSLTDRR